MASEFPFLQLCTADFYADHAALSPAVFGVLTRFMCYQWANGELPSDKAALCRIAGASRQEFAVAIKALTPYLSDTETGGLVLGWLDAERRRVRELSEKRAIAGRAGGRPSSKTEKQKESKTPLRASNSNSSSSIKNPEKNQEPKNQEPASSARAVPPDLGGPTDQSPMNLPPLEAFPEAVRDADCRALWAEWLRYKAAKRRKPYTTARGHLSELAAAASRGREVFLGAINNAMDHEWQGPNVQAFLEETGKAAAPFGRRNVSDGIARTRSGAEILPLPTAELVR